MCKARAVSSFHDRVSSCGTYDIEGETDNQLVYTESVVNDGDKQHSKVACGRDTKPRGRRSRKTSLKKWY